MRLVIAYLIGISLAAAPVANAALACQAEPGCCCCPQNTPQHGCGMACSDRPASSEQLSAVSATPAGKPVFKRAAVANVSTDPFDHSAALLVLAASPHRSTPAPPPKRYLLARVLRL